MCVCVCVCELLLINYSCKTTEDEWLTTVVNCLEQFSRSTDILNVIPSYNSSCLSDVDKVHTFQHLVDCCSRLASRHGPLWPNCYSGLLVELYRLLITTDSETLLHAMQLSVLLLPRNTWTQLHHLLLFMYCAASPSQLSLSSAASCQILLNVVNVSVSLYSFWPRHTPN